MYILRYKSKIGLLNFYCRLYPTLSMVRKKLERIAEVTVLLWRQTPLWGRVVICLVPAFTYEGPLKTMFSVGLK